MAPRPLPINKKYPATRRYAGPGSQYFRAWYAQKQRKARKFGPDWCLQTGYWNDEGQWVDEAYWKDQN